MSEIMKVFPLLFCILPLSNSFGQENLRNPISSSIYYPFIQNPAISGSKDFSSYDFTAGFWGESKSQMLSANARLQKKVRGNFSFPGHIEFRNIGIGGSIYNDIRGTYHNAGVSGVISYHIPLTTEKLSFISFGASVRGLYSFNHKSFYPNADIGVYYYGVSLFAGFSAINLLGNPGEVDTLGLFDIPMIPQYLLTAGYKFLISRPLKIVLEPSVIINANDSTISKWKYNINPMVKLYMDNVCIGTYLYDYNRINFFLQYKFPRIYLGAFVTLPKKAPYYEYKVEPIIELTLGVNISGTRSTLPVNGKW